MSAIGWLPFAGEVEKLRRELDSNANMTGQQREAFQQRLIQAEKESQHFQQALKNEKDSHDNDVRRITQDLVRH